MSARSSSDRRVCGLMLARSRSPIQTHKLECLTTCSNWKYVNVTITNVKRITSIGCEDDKEAIRRRTLRTLEDKLILVGGRRGRSASWRVVDDWLSRLGRAHRVNDELSGVIRGCGGWRIVLLRAVG